MVSSSKAYYGDYLKFQVGGLWYNRMGSLSSVMKTGERSDYSQWFSDSAVTSQYTRAQHNGSVATAKQLVEKIVIPEGTQMLDVGGGSGAFSMVFAGLRHSVTSVILEFPEVCATGREILATMESDVQRRVRFVELDATAPEWPVGERSFDIVLMSYISGSVPENLIQELYAKAAKALKPGARCIVHDFCVQDSLDGPFLGALWALQHVTVNPHGLGLCPKEVMFRMQSAGFNNIEVFDMIKGMTKVFIGHAP